MSAYCSQCDGGVDRDAGACASCGNGRPAGGWPTDVLLGASLRDRWRLDERLGGSAFETVYAGYDLTDGRPITFHSFNQRGSSLQTDQDRREAFLGRIEALGKLRSDHTARLVGVVDDGGVLGYVSEAYEGTLATTPLPLPIPDVLSIGTALARSLTEAHALGIPHGHVEPHTVLAREPDPDSGFLGIAVKLRGFADGVHVRRSFDERRQPARNPAYVAPERITGGPHSSDADCYALGVLLYELVCGQPPWEATDPLVLLREKQRRPAPSLRLVAPQAPDSLVDVVDGLLTRNPARRWPGSAAEIVQALNGDAPKRGVSRAAPLRFAVLGVAAGLILGGGGALLFRVLQSPPERPAAERPATIEPTRAPASASPDRPDAQRPEAEPR